MVHGTGGGFRQGLTFGKALAAAGYQIVAPSRFGYLRSSFPGDPSPARQADAFVALLDHLGIKRIAAVGGSAGALSVGELALRHPERCSAMVLLVPAANVEGRDPVEMGPAVQWGVRRLLQSDLLFGAALKLAPRWLIGGLLATDPELLGQVSASEQRRAREILVGLMPVSVNARGMLNDARLTGAPCATDFAGIRTPALVISTEDDRFNTLGTARWLRAAIPGASLRVFATGGHIWLGHDEEVAEAIGAFALKSSRAKSEGQAGPA